MFNTDNFKLSPSKHKIGDIHYIYNHIDLISKALRIYCVKLLDKTKASYLHSFSRGRLKLKNRLHVFNELGCGENNLIYKDLYIKIIQNEYLPAVGQDRDDISIYCTFELQVLQEDNELSCDKYQAIIEDLIEEAQKYYHEHVLDKIKEDNKTTIYIWDEYWETLEKRSMRKLNTIYLDGLEEIVLNTLKDFLSEETKEEYAELGIPYKFNTLFHGIPGTGKTSLIYSVASELKMDIALISFTKKMEDTDLLRAIRRVPDNTILVIEDIDGLFESRKKHDEIKNNITFSGLLNGLDGIGISEKQIVFLTTNHKLILDSALRRPGRIDYLVEFTYSNKNQIKTMFFKFLKQYKDNTEKFKEFYKAISHKKYTTAMLQQYFFQHRKDTEIMDSIKEILKLSDDNKYEMDKETLYS